MSRGKVAQPVGKGKTGRVGHRKGKEFSSTYRPKGKTGPRKKVRVEGTGKWDEKEVYRLAEQGVEQADIAVVLKLVGRLQGEPDLARKFEELVGLGHAHHRARTAMLMRSESEKGRSNPLIAMSKSWLARYAEETLTPEEEQGIAERVVELIIQRKEARKGVAAAEAV